METTTKRGGRSSLATGLSLSGNPSKDESASSKHHMGLIGCPSFWHNMWDQVGIPFVHRPSSHSHESIGTSRLRHKYPNVRYHNSDHTRSRLKGPHIHLTLKPHSSYPVQHACGRKQESYIGSFLSSRSSSSSHTLDLRSW